ncbi:type I-B CRISPR-associated protein Cas7/Cst2/DevR [Methanobrevibacter curvatus]|uniref:CRISPR-associated protein Cas7/Cst2/DevR n=1 Tax=Methanobrevibacter curvatus TaxID=49547 RepID=A0A166AHJ3_9EURY|nr:type I-B CRISPR-associated protein Cas7/Cst2/DevR [Methanobrevibacter curvatus]KZX12042.1 CRISPR-associated protein Cas7/Cst2/DevR [Methanobrevibacter curvatus]
MGKYIVLDIVFYGRSLNYDQGSGNYQELKKITKWDGKQHTLVSRYALRYSLLETAREFYKWDLVDGKDLINAGNSDDSKVIQLSNDLLFSGEILNYPEFDLFGYLITSTTPQNFRTAPVKIGHAISLTPFNYDSLFNANIGLANRVRKYKGKLEPNPFVVEEHETFYQYSIVIDVDNVGELEVYVDKSKCEIENNEGKWKIAEINDDLTIHAEKGSGKSKEKYEIKKSDIFTEKSQYNMSNIDNIYTFSFSIKNEERNNRIKELIQSIMNLKRFIKARDEDLSPKLMIVGIYENNPYQTYKDRICLLDEYTKEEYDEIEEIPSSDGKRVVKVKHKITKSKKPTFEVIGIEENNEFETYDQKEILTFIENFLNNNKNEKLCNLKLYHDPNIDITYKK